MQDNRRRRYEDERRGRGRWGFDRTREDARPRQFDDPRPRRDEYMYAERYRGEDRSWRDQGDGFAESRDRSEENEGRYGPFEDEQDYQSQGGLRDRYSDYDRSRGQHQTQAVGGHGAGWGGWRSAGRGAPAPNFAGKGPKGYQRSDDRIREEVSDRLTDDPHIDASDIVVEVRECEVNLSGTVSNRDQKRRAEDLVESISGVRDVTNHIRVARAQETEDQSSRSSIVGASGSPAGTKSKPTVGV